MDSVSRELRARSSAALTGLATARSRSGSDSTLCCHSVPSRRFATPCCHSVPLPFEPLRYQKKESTHKRCVQIKGSVSRELRARSSAALTAHCAVIQYRSPSSPCGTKKREHPQEVLSFFGGPSRARTLDRPVMSRLL